MYIRASLGQYLNCIPFAVFYFQAFYVLSLKQGSPDPGPQPVRNRAALPPELRLLSPSPPAPGLWETCLPRDQSLVPQRLGTTGLRDPEAEDPAKPCLAPDPWKCVSSEAAKFEAAYYTAIDD